MNNINYKETLNYYKSLSAEFFMEADEPIALHHIDMNLRRTDRSRYDEWRISDVVPLTRSEHCRIHHKGKKQSKAEKNLRRKTIKNSVRKSLLHRNCQILAFNDKNLYVFNTEVEAAAKLGVSRQQIYMVLSDLPQYEAYKCAAGYTLKWLV